MERHDEQQPTPLSNDETTPAGDAGVGRDDDGVQEAVAATEATVHSALDRIRASREILADSLKPIGELLGDRRADDRERPRVMRSRSSGGDSSPSGATPSGGPADAATPP